MCRSVSVVLPSLFVLLGRPVMAQDQGHGSVNMQGSIIDTPCVISMDSRDQTIELATIPVGQIIRDGMGPAKSFRIRLVNCVLQPQMPNRPDWSRFQVTFDGPVTDGNLFAVHGEVRGVGLKIADGAGNQALPGLPLPAGNLQMGNQSLCYTLRLMGNHQTLRAGSYRTTLRFKLDYF